MNVRFSDKSVRCRVTRAELDQMLSGRTVGLDVPLPEKHSFCLSVRPAAAVIGQWRLDSDPTGLWLTIPGRELEALAQSLPSKEGIEHEFETAGGGRVRVSLEVDLKSERASRRRSRERVDVAE